MKDSWNEVEWKKSVISNGCSQSSRFPVPQHRGNEGTVNKIDCVSDLALFVGFSSCFNEARRLCTSFRMSLLSRFFCRVIADAILYARDKYMDGNRSLLEVLQK